MEISLEELLVLKKKHDQEENKIAIREKAGEFQRKYGTLNNDDLKAVITI